MSKSIRSFISHRLIVAVLPLCVATGCVADPIASSRPSAETWAFCGVHPDEPTALKRAKTLATVAGIDASFGPCLPVDWATYTTANPGDRYMDPAGYKRALLNNAAAGMKTIVYDARIWSTSASVRQAAITFWQPHLANIRAWDMGDEFDPASPDWGVLVARWNLVLATVTPATGVGPFTNHLGNSGIMNQALVDMPAQAGHLSYDAYDIPLSLALAAEFAPKISHLMCAINALDHSRFRPTNLGIESQMLDHRDAGCDSFLIFGGDMPYGTDGFTTPSLVNSNGTPTWLAEAVYKGAL